jgi:hypothetical protein
LAERQKRAQRRSGARGKLARSEEIEGEKVVQEAMKRYVSTAVAMVYIARANNRTEPAGGAHDDRLEICKVQVDTVARLTEMMTEVQVTLDLVSEWRSPPLLASSILSAKCAMEPTHCPARGRGYRGPRSCDSQRIRIQRRDD